MNDKKKIFVLQKLNKLYEDLIRGEVEDVNESISASTIKQYFKIVDKKTGALFVYPVEIAAYIVDADKKNN